VFKCYVTKEEFEKLKNNDKFVTAIRLLRMESAIITSLSLFERSTNGIEKETSRDKRDRFESILYYGATLYQSLKTFSQMKEKLENLDEYKKNIAEINKLISGLNNDDSFIKNILGKMRDKLVFHFDNNPFVETFSILDSSESEVVIFEGDSYASVDANFPIVFEIYYNYLIKQFGIEGSDEEKLEKIFNEMNLISRKLREIIGNIAGELLKDSVHYKET
jgi:hypothetical protein